MGTFTLKQIRDATLFPPPLPPATTTFWTSSSTIANPPPHHKTTRSEQEQESRTQIDMNAQQRESRTNLGEVEEVDEVGNDWENVYGLLILLFALLGLDLLVATLRELVFLLEVLLEVWRGIFVEGGAVVRSHCRWSDLVKKWVRYGRRENWGRGFSKKREDADFWFWNLNI